MTLPMARKKKDQTNSSPLPTKSPLTSEDRRQIDALLSTRRSADRSPSRNTSLTTQYSSPAARRVAETPLLFVDLDEDTPQISRAKRSPPRHAPYGTPLMNPGRSIQATPRRPIPRNAVSSSLDRASTSPSPRGSRARSIYDRPNLPSPMKTPKPLAENAQQGLRYPIHSAKLARLFLDYAMYLREYPTTNRDAIGRSYGYEEIARVLDGLQIELNSVELIEGLRGVGPKTKQLLEEYLTTGNIEEFEHQEDDDASIQRLQSDPEALRGVLEESRRLGDQLVRCQTRASQNTPARPRASRAKETSPKRSISTRRR